jgi:cell division protease FtsH
MRNGNLLKSLLIWLLIGLGLMVVFNKFNDTRDTKNTVPYSQFIGELEGGQIKSIVIEGNNMQSQWVNGVRKDDSKFTTFAPFDPQLINDLIKNKVTFQAKPKEESLLMNIFISWFPMLLLIGIWIYFMKGAAGGKGGGGIGGVFGFGKSRAKMIDSKENLIRFNDVAGCEESKQEVMEIVDYLKDPTKYQNLGGRIPKGVLLSGSPGTGKTLLAKAIAGEASVPFFSISGSDFVEMFVGVGASRVRDLFEQAKKNAPAIIFIDEIDAVGRQRGAGLGGGNDEREQTLNQMLVEMDGFDTNTTVIIIAATNRPDVLDPALMRPGRFDRQVVVPLPDIKGREQILNVHMRKVPVANDVEGSIIARGTPGFSGADLANLVNEAALFAARRNKKLVDMHDFEDAKDKIIMGAERRSMVMKDDEKRNTAYHESGHAIVARLLPGTDPVHKVTIIPRGRALGVTMQLPEEDRYSYTKDYLINQIAILFGGRVAEEIFMNQMTTGASNDFERATDLARKIVTRFGMTDEMGPVVYGENESELFLGRSVTSTKHVSEATMQKIDETVRGILEDQYKVARRLLTDNRDKVEMMAKMLLEIETIDAKDIEYIMTHDANSTTTTVDSLI